MIYADQDLSLDGFTTGPSTSLSAPLGVGGEELIWYGDDVNVAGEALQGSYGETDAMLLEQSAANDGAVVMGARTFELSIGDWGENPPIHMPCFVVSQEVREPVRRADTTFTFVPEVSSAVALAAAAAGAKDVCVMGGATTIAACANLGLLDELHLHVMPTLLREGTTLLDKIRDVQGLRPRRVSHGRRAVHVVYACREPVSA